MKFQHFVVAGYGVLAVPVHYGAAVGGILLESDFDGFYIPRMYGSMVAQLPGAFWVK